MVRDDRGQFKAPSMSLSGQKSRQWTLVYILLEESTYMPIRCGLVVRMLASQFGRKRERPGFDSPQRKIFLAFLIDLFWPFSRGLGGWILVPILAFGV